MKEKTIKALLLNPPPINGVRFSREGRCQEKEVTLGALKPPLSLCSMAAMLKSQGAAWRLVDANALNMTAGDVAGLLAKENFRPDIIFAATCTPTISADAEALAFLKKETGAAAAAFGPHTSGIPSETLAEFPALDIAIHGEPEQPAAMLCRGLEPERLKEMPGIAYRDGGQIVLNPGRFEFKNLDDMPRPIWDDIPLEAYKLPGLGRPYLLVETSRGCPWSCDFCVVPLLHESGMRSRGAGSVADEIDALKGRHGVDIFQLWGDTVTARRQFMLEFSEELLRRNLNISWLSNSRTENLGNPEDLKLFARSGCTMISFGVELSDDDLRRRLTKEKDRQKIRQSVRNLRAAGIESFIYFIIGYPGESRRSIRETVRFSLWLDPDYAAFYPAVPYPGTSLFKLCSDLGIIETKEWSKYDYSSYVLKNESFDEELILKARAAAYRSFYLRARFLWRTFRRYASAGNLGVLVRQGLQFLKWTQLSGGPRESYGFHSSKN